MDCVRPCEERKKIRVSKAKSVPVKLVQEIEKVFVRSGNAKRPTCVCVSKSKLILNDLKWVAFFFFFLPYSHIVRRLEPIVIGVFGIIISFRYLLNMQQVSSHVHLFAACFAWINYLCGFFFFFLSSIKINKAPTIQDRVKLSIQFCKLFNRVSALFPIMRWYSIRLNGHKEYHSFSLWFRYGTFCWWKGICCPSNEIKAPGFYLSTTNKCRNQSIYK